MVFFLPISDSRSFMYNSSPVLPVPYIWPPAALHGFFLPAYSYVLNNNNNSPSYRNLEDLSPDRAGSDVGITPEKAKIEELPSTGKHLLVDIHQYSINKRDFIRTASKKGTLFSI